MVWVWFVSPNGCVLEAWSPVNDSNRNGASKSLGPSKELCFELKKKMAQWCRMFAGLSEDLNPLPSTQFR